jgi:hypothetical protein
MCFLLLTTFVLPSIWSALVPATIVGGIGLVMVGMLVGQLRRMRSLSQSFDSAFTQLLEWKPDSMADLSWGGDYAYSAGPFRSRLRFVLNRLSDLRDEGFGERLLIEGHRGGPACFELHTTGVLRPLLVWRRRATLRTRQETLSLHLRCSLGMWRLRSARVENNGQWVGDLTVAPDGSVIALSDSSGESVGQWKTGQRLLKWFDPGLPQRGPLLVRGQHLGDILVPSVPLWNNSMRCRAEPLITNPRSVLTSEQRSWLLAVLAISTYALGVSRGMSARHHTGGTSTSHTLSS